MHHTDVGERTAAPGDRRPGRQGYDAGSRLGLSSPPWPRSPASCRPVFVSTRTPKNVRSPSPSPQPWPAAPSRARGNTPIVSRFCQSCQRVTGHKRALGWGTFFASVVTLGVWLLAIPFYPKRCVICGALASQQPDSEKVPPRPRSVRVTLGVLALLVVSIIFAWSRIQPPEPRSEGMTQFVQSAAGDVRTLREFEASAFAKRHRPLRTSSWPLKAGGTNTSYSYVDPDSDSSCSIEFVIKENVIQSFAVSWQRSCQAVCK